MKMVLLISSNSNGNCVLLDNCKQQDSHMSNLVYMHPTHPHSHPPTHSHTHTHIESRAPTWIDTYVHLYPKIVSLYCMFRKKCIMLKATDAFKLHLLSYVIIITRWDWIQLITPEIWFHTSVCLKTEGLSSDGETNALIQGRILNL